MSTLLYDTLTTELETSFRPDRNMLIRGFKPWLFRVGTPAGTARLELRDENGRLIQASENEVLADIGEGTNWHGSAGIILKAGLRLDTTYRVALVAGGGYAFSDAAHIGWCLDYAQDRKVRLGYTEAGRDQSPYGLEAWTVQEKTRGVRYGY